jgi:hypothetical protein
MVPAVICLRIVVLHERLASAPVHEGPTQRMAGDEVPTVFHLYMDVVLVQQSA